MSNSWISCSFKGKDIFSNHCADLLVKELTGYIASKYGSSRPIVLTLMYVSKAVKNP